MDLTGPVRGDDRDNATVCVPPPTAELLRAAGRGSCAADRRAARSDHRRVSGVRRMRRRSRQRGKHPDLARLLHAPPTFINHSGFAGEDIRDRDTFARPGETDRKQLQITINDVVMAIAAGALRELLLRYDGARGPPLVASVSGQHRQIAAPDQRQRAQWHGGVAADAHRRSDASGCG